MIRRMRRKKRSNTSGTTIEHRGGVAATKKDAVSAFGRIGLPYEALAQYGVSARLQKILRLSHRTFFHLNPCADATL